MKYMLVLFRPGVIVIVTITVIQVIVIDGTEHNVIENRVIVMRYYFAIQGLNLRAVARQWRPNIVLASAFLIVGASWRIHFESCIT